MNDQDKWEHMVREVCQLRDALDMPVDSEIIETVAALRLLGFDTILSCAGHTDRDTWGPYVAFESIKATPYSERWQKARNKRSMTAKMLQKQAVRANARERFRLHRLLVEFYGTHPSSYEQTLCVRPLGLSANRLESLNAGIDSCLNVTSKSEMIVRRQEEMKSFTRYLKESISSENVASLPT